MSAEATDTTIVYLARGIGAGDAAAHAFLDTYCAKRAGHPHHLVVIFKGWENYARPPDLIQRIVKRSGTILDLPDDGLDLGAYFRVMPHIDSKWVCFLNTNSRILADDWLLFFRRAAEDQNMGAVGASGSFESPYNSALAVLRSTQNRQPLKDMLRLAYYRRLFRPFPNVHLRSNGFLCRSELFRQYAAHHSFPRNKRDTHLIEAGRHGFSAYLQNQGLGVAVVDINGSVHAPASWPESQTFRVAGHKNLLISDNQTRGFDDADIARQLELQIMAWGRQIKAIGE